MRYRQRCGVNVIDVSVPRFRSQIGTLKSLNEVEHREMVSEWRRRCGTKSINGRREMCNVRADTSELKISCDVKAKRNAECWERSQRAYSVRRATPETRLWTHQIFASEHRAAQPELRRGHWGHSYIKLAKRNILNGASSNHQVFVIHCETLLRNESSRTGRQERNDWITHRFLHFIIWALIITSSFSSLQILIIMVNRWKEAYACQLIETLFIKSHS